ncbi:MAG: helix-turn-helix transcriptional regulator, partial [Bacillota bacterium]|nr:helix-turn-helix transcriptional regulator [Bacillota bacterium]
IVLAFLTVLIHTAMLEAFRDSVNLLCILYFSIAVAVALLYFVLQPHLIYAFHTHPAEESIPVEQSSFTAEETLKENSFDKLSPQELRLAELILKGYTNSEIAESMHLTIGTVKGYRKNLYSKLQIHSKKELFEIAQGK